MGQHDDETRNVNAVPAPLLPSTKWRSRRWLTGIGTAGALFASQFAVQLYLAIAKADVLKEMAWYFFATYGLCAGVAVGYITAKTYRDVMLAKLGAAPK